MAARNSRRPPDAPISMYVPARNAAAHLADCIQAIRNQTRPPDELFILLDSRSGDGTGEIAAATGVRVIEQQGPTLGAARNEAIAAAQHRWLASCDSDVIIERDWLERLAERRGDGAVGIAGRTIERVRNPCDQWRSVHMPHHWGDYPLRNPFMLVSEVIFDRQALLGVGGYREDLNYSEDSDLCQRLREAGHDLLYEPAALAAHQRSDDLIGLLTLRWKYSEYRQRHLMDRYAGLVAKCGVNREYALNTLSRSLARQQEGLAYISFFLFFHHLAMDLRSLLSRRPLIAAGARGQYEQQLVDAVVPIIADRHPGLARAVEADLSRLCGAGQPDARTTPFHQGWTDYLERIRTASAGFCAEFSPALLEVIEAAARHTRGQTGSDDVPRLPALSPETLRAALDGVPIQPFIDEIFCRSIKDHWPDTSDVHPVGPLADEEQVHVDGHGPLARDDGHTVLLAAHLEARPDPLGIFAELDDRYRRLVACYQPPVEFIAGLDVPSAGDLASAAAAAGWTIERFDTLVGRTRLVLSRSPAMTQTATHSARAMACPV